MALAKIKRANKKWKHDHRRKQRTMQEKRRLAQAKENIGRENNKRRLQQQNYVDSLRGEILNEV